MSEKQQNDIEKIFAKANSSIPDMAAIARIGGFGLASKFSEVKQIQLNRELERARKTDNLAKTARLAWRIKLEKQRQLSLINQSQREQLKTPTVSDKAATIVGRVICDGCGAKNYRATLMGAGKKSLDSQSTSVLGAFELKTSSFGIAHLIVSNKKGEMVKVLEFENELEPGQLKFLEIDISGLSPIDEVPPVDTGKPGSRPDKVKVPDLRGHPLEPAKKATKKLGLVLRSSGFVDDRNNIDLISTQRPEAGDAIEIGGVINVKIGRKPQKKMRNFTDSPAAETFEKIDKDDLRIENIELVKDPKKAGIVIDQFPPKGATVRPGASVRIRVATGAAHADHALALLLLSQDKSIKALDIPAKDLAKRFNNAEVKSFDELRKFTLGKQADIQKALNLQKPETAKLIKSTLRAVLKKFPD